MSNVFKFRQNFVDFPFNCYARVHYGKKKSDCVPGIVNTHEMSMFFSGKSGEKNISRDYFNVHKDIQSHSYLGL